MSETVIKIENLYKEYRLGVISHRALYRDLQSWWAKIRKKDDPNAPISARHQISPTQLIDKSSHFWALSDVSFEVNKGDVVGIIGRNGAGKSTLLKILSKVTTPTKGAIKIKGRIASLLEVGTGFHPELTGMENIYLNGAILGMTKREIKSKIDEIIYFAEIEKFIDTPVKRYSSGMYVRLAFAVAAHLEPEILIVDEVLAVGDAEFQKKCLGKMKDVAGQGRTVLFVSHNMSAVTSLCNRGLLLNNGKLIFEGTAPEAVNVYMTQSFGNLTEVKWNGSAPGDEYVVLHCLRLIDRHGNTLNYVEMTNEIGIELKYEILNEDCKPTPGIVFYSAMNMVAFISTMENDCPNKKGIYKTVLWIPQNLLNDITYYLRVVIMTFIPEKIHVDQKEILVMNVVEDMKNRQTNFMQKWHGVLRPKLVWSSEKM